MYEAKCTAFTNNFNQTGAAIYCFLYTTQNIVNFKSNIFLNCLKKIQWYVTEGGY